MRLALLFVAAVVVVSLRRPGVSADVPFKQHAAFLKSDGAASTRRRASFQCPYGSEPQPVPQPPSERTLGRRREALWLVPGASLPLCPGVEAYGSINTAFFASATNGDVSQSDKPASNDNKQSWFYIRPAMMQDMGPASQILTDGFFKSKTNFIMYYWERLVTYLSLEASLPQPNTVHSMFVACDIERNGRVIGLVEVDARKGGSGRGDDGPYMCNLAIHEDYRRRGVATALVREVERQATDWWKDTGNAIPNRLCLKVRRSSDGAIHMYERLGYTSYLEEKDKDGDLIVSMRRDLSDSPSATESTAAAASSSSSSSSSSQSVGGA